MSKSTEFRKLVTQGLPIALIILYLLFPVVFVRASEHPLGKFVAVMMIVLYTYQDMIQGLIICLLIIIFYHKEVEGFISETTQNYVDFLPKPSRKTNNEFENHLEKDFTPIEDAYPEKLHPVKKVSEFLFRRDFCDASLNNVKYKDQKVKNCLVTHVYPELQFRDGECNPCDKTCHFSVQHKQRVEQHLQPTSSKRGIVWDMLDSMVGSTDEPIVLNKQIATKIIE
jgi:hypothetical protein